jgi:hypothetical protein
VEILNEASEKTSTGIGCGGGSGDGGGFLSILIATPTNDKNADL